MKKLFLMGFTVVALCLGMMSCSTPDVDDPQAYCWEVKLDNEVIAYEWATGGVMQTELDSYNNLVRPTSGKKAKAYKTKHENPIDCIAADETLPDHEDFDDLW